MVPPDTGTVYAPAPLPDAPPDQTVPLTRETGGYPGEARP
jgi:hypothetical protein